MRDAASAAALLITLLCGVTAAGGVRAQASEPTRVTVDWSQVSDADIARCGLSRLRAGTLERLVDDGYAVMDAIDERGVRVAAASVSEGVRLHVESAGIVREDTLRIAAGCDATFVLDVIARVSTLVDEVARARPALPAPQAPAVVVSANDAAQSPASVPSSPPAARSGWQLSLDASARVNESPAAQFGGGVVVRRRLPAAWEAGTRVELTGNAELGVTVLEPALLLSGAWQPALPGAGFYMEVGPLLHVASSDVRSVLEVDAEVGAGLQLSLGHFWAQLGAYARLRRFEHRVGTKTAFDTGRVGLVLRIGAQLFGS